MNRSDKNVKPEFSTDPQQVAHTAAIDLLSDALAGKRYRSAAGIILAHPNAGLLLPDTVTSLTLLATGWGAVSLFDAIDVTEAAKAVLGQGRA